MAALMLLLGSSTASVASGPQHSPRLLPMASRLCADYINGTFTVENLGDSIADGHGAPTSQRWFNRLATQLPTGSAAWNGAVGGSLMEMYQPGGQLYFHTQFTKNVKPTVVIMNWRVNEQWMAREYAGYDPVSFKARFLSIINDIKSASPNTTVVLAISPWILDTRIDDAQWTQWDYINKMWEVKVETNSLWLDWMRFFPKYAESDSLGLLEPDLIHPSARGQRVMASDMFGLFSGYCKGLTQTG